MIIYNCFLEISKINFKILNMRNRKKRKFYFHIDRLMTFLMDTLNYFYKM